MIEHKINVNSLREMVNAIESLQNAGLDNEAKRILYNLCDEIQKIRTENRD